MKRLLVLFTFCFVIGCRAKQAKLNRGRLEITSEQRAETSSINGVILELLTGDKLPVSDIWIGDVRYPCDSLSNFYVRVEPGTYRLTGRALGYQSIAHRLRIKKGNRYTLTFKLSQFVDRTAPNPFH